jgi:type VI protein secretion system component Hcp
MKHFWLLTVIAVLSIGVTAARAGGKANSSMHEITIPKHTDQATPSMSRTTPRLYNNTSQGQHIKDGRLH